jgi:hypothetical protein
VGKNNRMKYTYRAFLKLQAFLEQSHCLERGGGYASESAGCLPQGPYGHGIGTKVTPALRKRTRIEVGFEIGSQYGKEEREKKRLEL